MGWAQISREAGLSRENLKKAYYGDRSLNFDIGLKVF